MSEPDDAAYVAEQEALMEALQPLQAEALSMLLDEAGE